MYFTAAVKRNLEIKVKNKQVIANAKAVRNVVDKKSVIISG